MGTQRKVTKARNTAAKPNQDSEFSEDWEDHLPPGYVLGGEIGVVGAFWAPDYFKPKK